MIRDVNFTFMWLIVSLLIAMLGISIYYQTSYGSVLKEYGKTADNLTAAQARLAYIENYFSEAASEVNVSKEREEALGSRYLEIRSQKETLDAENKELTADLDSTRAQLSSLQSSYDILSNDYGSLKQDYSNLSQDYLNIVSELATKQSTISSQQAEINSLNSQLSECQEQQGGGG